MGVIRAGSTVNTNAGTKTVTATPLQDDLIVVLAVATAALTGAITDDQGGTYVPTQTRGGFSTTGNFDIWIRTSLIPATVSTVFTAIQASSTGGGLVVYRISDMARVGLEAVRSAAGIDGGTPALQPHADLNLRAANGTFPASGSLSRPTEPLATSVMIAVLGNGTNPNSVTPPLGYTADPAGGTGYTIPTTGFSTSFLPSDAAPERVITWGSLSATSWASEVIELDTTVPGATFGFFPRRRRSNGVSW